MKMKKSHIFFICYYAAAIIGTVLAAVLLRERVNFSAWSAFPITCSLFSLFTAWFCGSGRAEAFVLKQWRIEAEWNISAPVPDTLSKESNPLFHHIFITYLFLAPLFLSLIVFLQSETKAFLSIAIVFLGFFSCSIYHIWGHLSRQDKARQNKENDEKKQQQEREELGKWK